MQPLGNSQDILVVDDSADIRSLLRLHLHNAGYNVRVAEDALEAGRMVLAKRPDLMICDIDMPYMNGLDFVEALVGDKTIQRFPIIFLTSRADSDDRAKALGAGFLTKPILLDRLLGSVAKALEG